MPGLVILVCSGMIPFPINDDFEDDKFMGAALSESSRVSSLFF